jgi:hypothetical protein
VDFLPDIACSRGRIRRPGATCEPATGNFSHNTHIQACHVQLAPQIFSATVLFSAPLSRKHSCRVIGASLRSLPTVSDGETAITNTLPMRISHGKPSLPVSRLPSRNDLSKSPFKVGQEIRLTNRPKVVLKGRFWPFKTTLQKHPSKKAFKNTFKTEPI